MRDYNSGEIDSRSTTSRRNEIVSHLHNADLPALCFVEFAACLGFPKECTRMAQETWPQLLLCMGCRVDEERYGSLPCDCVDADGNSPAETRSAWLVASRNDTDRGGKKPCWVYSQVLQQRASTEFVPQRFEDSRLWWSERYSKDRKAVVVYPKVGSYMAYKHHRRSACDGRWFPMCRFRGVEGVPLDCFFRPRSSIRKEESVSAFQERIGILLV